MSLKNIYGTLPDWVIREFIRQGTILIDPLSEDWESQLGTITIDFHLGTKIMVPKEASHKYVDVRRGVEEADFDTIILKENDPHLMQPGQFIIAPTVEYLRLPDDIMGRLEGRSSLARLGIVVHLSSGRFDPGWRGWPTLELKNNGTSPVIIYGGMSMCAFSFERLMAKVERPYTKRGRYAEGNVMRSLIEEDNKSIIRKK